MGALVLERGRAMAEQTEPASMASFQVGDRVYLKGYEGLLGIIIELRGPLGPNGEPIYGVDLRRRPVVADTEVREGQLVPAPAPVKVGRTRSSKISARRLKAGKRAMPRWAINPTGPFPSMVAPGPSDDGIGDPSRRPRSPRRPPARQPVSRPVRTRPQVQARAIARSLRAGAIGKAPAHV
jgi:hypothetical protein